MGCAVVSAHISAGVKHAAHSGVIGWQVGDVLLSDSTSFNIGVLNQNKLLRPLRALSGPSSEGAWAKEGGGLQLLQGGGSGLFPCH